MKFDFNDITLIIIIGTVLFVAILIFIFFFIIQYQKRQSYFANEKKILHSNFTQTLLQTQLEIQEQTFRNISQEIHDNIGQVLSLAKLNINTMNGEEPKALQLKIDDSKHLISKAIQDLRDLSRSLNTDYVIEMGLLRSIEYELELMKRTGTIETRLQVEGKAYRLEQQQELILFRIVQEVLHNIIKHAKANLVEVYLDFAADMFTMKITDNGVGFDASKLEADDYSGFGLGIRSMHNRAKMINTHFRLSSTVGAGVTVTLDLPIVNTIK